MVGNCNILYISCIQYNTGKIDKSYLQTILLTYLFIGSYPKHIEYLHFKSFKNVILGKIWNVRLNGTFKSLIYKHLSFFFIYLMQIISNVIIQIYIFLFQRLIPVDSGNDLFIYKAPDVPTSKVYTIRPYHSTDQQQIYSVCQRTCKDGLEDSHPLSDSMKEIAADRFVLFLLFWFILIIYYWNVYCVNVYRIVGPYVTLHPELCMVVEEDDTIVGYACAALDCKKYRLKQEDSWIPEMCSKYPQNDDDKNLSKFGQVIYWHIKFFFLLTMVVKYVLGLY